jgi:hypothetical protein
LHASRPPARPQEQEVPAKTKSRNSPVRYSYGHSRVSFRFPEKSLMTQTTVQRMFLGNKIDENVDAFCLFLIIHISISFEKHHCHSLYTVIHLLSHSSSAFNRTKKTMFRSLLVSLLLVPCASARTRTRYDFEKDAVGAEKCADVQADMTEEEFRIDCISQVEAFEMCSISCSKALHFKGSKGRVQDQNSFYELEFEEAAEMGGGKHPYSMGAARGKTTVFATVPLWASQSQYFYELSEKLYRRFNKMGPLENNFEIVLLPIVVEDAIAYIKDEETGKSSIKMPEIRPLKEKNVHILIATHPNMIMSSPFLKFLTGKVVSTSVSSTFDVYTDRVVAFVVSSDGNTIERLVMPTMKQLGQTIRKNMAQAGTAKEL